MKKAALIKSSSILFVLTLGLQVAASELRSDVLLVIPKKVVRTAAPDFQGSYSYAAGNLTIPGQFPADTTNFVTSFNYQITSLDPLANGHFDTVVSLSDFKINMDTFHIDQTIEQEQNGVIVRIQVKIDCNGMVVAARRAFDVTGSAQIKNPLGVAVNTVNLPVDQTLWQVTAASCVPANSIPFLEQKINESFANSVDVRNYVINQVNQNVASWFAANRNFTQDFPSFGAKVDMQTEEFIDNPDSWIVRMPTKVTSNKECPTMRKMGTIPSIAPTATVPDEIQLQTSEKVLQVLGKCAHEMATFNRVDSTSTIQVFQDLMSSAAAKAVVWPDLSRFPAGSEFNLHTKTSGTIFDLVPTAGAGAANSIYYTLTGNMITKMMYLRSEVEEKYVQFFSPISGTIEAVGRANGWNQPSTLTFQFYGAPTMNLQYVFQVPRSVVKDSKIDVTKIQPELIKAVQSKTFTFPVNPFPLNTTRQVQFFGLGRDGTHLQLKMGIAKKP